MSRESYASDDGRQPWASAGPSKSSVGRREADELIAIRGRAPGGKWFVLLRLSVVSPYRVAPDRSLDAAQDATSGQVRSLSGLSFFWLADATTNALVQLGTRFDARLRKQIPTLVDGVVLLRFFAIEHSALASKSPAYSSSPIRSSPPRQEPRSTSHYAPSH